MMRSSIPKQLEFTKEGLVFQDLVAKEYDRCEAGVKLDGSGVKLDGSGVQRLLGTFKASAGSNEQEPRCPR